MSLAERLKGMADDAEEVVIESNKAVNQLVDVLLENIDEIIAALGDNGRYLNAFAHYHVNSGDGSDKCRQCGLDLRDPIHSNKRVAKEPQS